MAIDTVKEEELNQAQAGGAGADARGRRSVSGEATLGIRQSDGSVRSIVGRLVDVSDYGFGIETQGSLQVGARVTVDSTFFDNTGPEKREVAQVVHCRLKEGDTYRSGLAFDQGYEDAEDINRSRPKLDDGFVDYYEALQISPHADSETIQRVYRMLAQRYHPDNAESGSEESFRLVLAAYRVLSDPEKRAEYDVKHQGEQQVRWQVFSKPQETMGVEEEKRMRMGVLSALYTSRQRQPEKPEMSHREMESLLGIPREHLEFGFWYLRGRGLVERSDNGRLRITPDGVDAVEESKQHGLFKVTKLLEGPPSE